MATKGQIAEQVLRIVNGGDISDDSKVTMQEVGTLLEHERDSLVRKTILENATLGEHEIPNEFLSVHKLELENDTMYGKGGRAYVDLPQMPINLPNDGSIYRVCKLASDYEKDLVTEHIIQAPGYAEWGGTHFDAAFPFEIKYIDSNSKTVSSSNIGRKFVFSFKFGQGATALTDYQFTFDYLDFSNAYPTPTEVSLVTLKPDWLVYSLIANTDFQNWCRSHKMKVAYHNTRAGVDDTVGTYRDGIRFISADIPGSFGDSTSENHFDIKSALTGESIVNKATTYELSTSWAEGITKFFPVHGFSFYIWYPKNKRLLDMEADNLGVKGKGSNFLNFKVQLTQSDSWENTADGYSGITPENMANMWANKYRHILKMYGIAFEMLGGGRIKIMEDQPLGGFGELGVDPSAGSAGQLASLESGSSVVERTEPMNYNTLDCYNRMPNPGMSSRMYDNAILLSGRKYWYRQEGRLYLYNEPHNSNVEGYLSGNASDSLKTTIAIWMLAKSSSLNMGDEFPMPSDAISEVIKSLVATFGMMRAAKEDNINNNVDTT
tara:strand:+ start:2288 stop:3934 length:1647 start_codon:yes stop_codon:yes gene_type:complete